MISYSADVKTYLCRKTEQDIGMKREVGKKRPLLWKNCCREAFFYGAAVFSKGFDTHSMTLSFDREDVPELLTYILLRDMLCRPAVTTRKKGTKTVFDVTFGSELVGKELKEKLAEEEVDFEDRFLCDGCRPAFLRGLFLACGSVVNPASGFRVEFCVKTEKEADTVRRFLDGFSHSVKLSRRSGLYVLYAKGSEAVSDFFTVIGAEPFALDVIEKSIEREMKNTLNRACNCETSNTRKTVRASVDMRKIIGDLKKSGRFDGLPEELKEAAEWRLKYPEASLSELCALSGDVLSRSGLNHRFRKLTELAREMK